MTDALILFTRYPEAGRAKTRLIPQLGAEGAAELQRRMTQHAAGRAWAFCAARPKRRLIVAHEGGDSGRMREWLGPLRYEPQGGGDLGERMRRAVERALKQGAKKVLIMGSDCPALDEERLSEAMQALDDGDVVFGPAQDGGYYLIGMKQAHLRLFESMPWGTAAVLAESLRRAEETGLRVVLLPTLADVDEPADLPRAEDELNQGRSVSVIIPALNEAAALEPLLPVLQAAQPREIIVSDGGSRDGTVEVATRHGARVVCGERGRARQMNAAARMASAEHLLFLHADTVPPVDFARLAADCLAAPGVAAGAFHFKLSEPLPLRGVIERLVAARCRLRQMPYGDQGLFLRRSLFEALGGFSDLPILEDVELVRTLRRAGRVVTLPQAAATSARRWQRGGVWRTFLRHQLILCGHACGIAPARLARLRSVE